jgi:biotin carboxylase
MAPLPTYEMARNKSALGRFMQEEGIPTPLTIEKIDEQLEARLEQLHFPVLLKPVHGFSGSGIVRVDEKQALLNHLQAHHITTGFIIQEYIDGYDIDCNLLYQNGEVICYNIQRGLLPGKTPYHPSMGLAFEEQPEVFALVDRLMKALRWSGPANLDLRYHNASGTFKVIEINPRFWMTVIASAKATGLNFPVLACHIAMNPTCRPPQPQTGKYIPLSSFIRHKLSGKKQVQAAFAWNDIDVAYTFKSLLPKLYLAFKKR